MSGRLSISGIPGGIIPTPDPTIGSVISDEDVALQLMRLGDASNFSTHGRTSTGTLDDALSGKAEAASSEEDSEDCSVADENQLTLNPFGHRPVGIRNSLGSDLSENDYEDRQDGSLKEEGDKLTPEEWYKKHKTARSMSKSSTKVRKWKVKTSEDPASPASLPAMSRKTSNASLNFQHFQKPFGEDEEDLSTKPRCQRCRKSKKGCDRQRPCARCRDAGIGIEGCVSEDEGNGRKGRFGRHMGVPIKKGTSEAGDSMDLDGPQTFITPTAMAPPPLVSDKSKKRKR
jgi:hypothetical protein